MRVDPTEGLLTIISRMNAINEIRVDAQNSYFSGGTFTVRVFETAVKASSTTVMTLNLILPLASFEAFVPAQVNLPSLKKFAIQMSSWGHPYQMDESMTQRLLPFLDAHRHTLASLSLVSLDNTNLSLLLSRLPYMPLLHTLHLIQGWSMRPSYPVPMAVFYSEYSTTLTTYRSQLKHFSMRVLHSRPTSFTDFFQMAWCHIPLPKLESLILGLPSLETDVDASVLASYLQQYSSTLTSLTLTYCVLRLQHLEPILSVFPIPCLLRNLDLDVGILKPEIFTVIAMCLPDLESLTLSFYSLSLESEYEQEPAIFWTPPAGESDCSYWALVSDNAL